ncbi:MAG: magnesium-protoporphyrin IX monomethyl ester (oxidative) cyclase [Myxococcota bacterium]
MKTREVNETTRMAQQTTTLSPRFYTTDYAALDRIDVTPVRAEWDALIEELESDPNRKHFKRGDKWDLDMSRIKGPLKEEFLDFLVSSLTAEFSGCVLYAEMRKRGTNREMIRLFGTMSRDESRHAGFINDALRDFGVEVDLGFLTKKKKYTFFSPKFIFYATYLSEKIGYARYITIFRHLERHPELAFHPIFKWFEEWCNDEFRHGEAFALLMRADPKLLSGLNRYWIRFFQLAVFTTMFVRDHNRPAFHEALQLDPADYGMEVFRKTVAISRQVFPIVLDVESDGFRQDLVRMAELSDGIREAERRGGVSGFVKASWLRAKVVWTFGRMYLRRPVANELPAQSRLQPSY